MFPATRSSELASFQHLLLTRFNLRRGFAGWVPPDEAWLDDRFQLFETFCLPSVRGQSVQAFDWLVFFDQGTPERFRDRIRAYEAEGRLHALFVAEGGEPEWEAVRERLRPGCEWVLTTRLDNDDALHVDFVATLQAAFRPAPGLLNLAQGYVLDAARGRLYRSRQLTNPFLSRCEPAGEVRTVLQAGAHDAVGAPVQQVAAGPLWLQVVHGRNAANRVTPHMQRLPLASLDSGFRLEGFSTAASENRLLLGLENALRRVSSGLRRFSSALRRGLRRSTSHAAHT